MLSHCVDDLPENRCPGMPERPAASGRVARAVAPDDVPRLRDLIASLPEVAWSEASLLAELARPDSRIWLASGGTQRAAQGLLVARRVLDELHVLDVAVAAAHRRTGLGRALVEQALAWASQSGLRAALLELRASNQPAHALYSACGFVVVGRRARYYPGGEDALLMTLDPLAADAKRVESERADSEKEGRVPLRADAEVLEIRAEAGEIHRLLLSVPEWPGAEPGQFLMLSAGARAVAERSDPLLPRPMAVFRGHAPAARGGRGRIEILCKASGRGTRLIADCLPGQRLRIVGPLGRPFPPVAAGSRAILVGGGTGVASLYELAARAAGQASVSVLLGARSRSDLLAASDFAALGVDLRVTTEDGSAGERGLVTQALAPLLEAAAGGPTTTLYACGPTAMMRACAALAAPRGVRCLVSLENGMACGFGVCLGCAVPRREAGYALVCKDGPVFDASEVRWEGLP